MKPLSANEFQKTNYEDRSGSGSGAGWYQKIDTRDLPQIETSGFYGPCVINYAAIEHRTFTGKNGKDFETEKLALQLVFHHPSANVDMYCWLRLTLNWTSGRERAAELIRLFGLRDENGEENFRTREYDGREYVDDLLGKQVDVVLDDVYWKNGYLNMTPRGFFLNRMSWQEIAHGVPGKDCTDLKDCMANCHMQGYQKAIEEGKELPWVAKREADNAAMSQPYQTPLQTATGGKKRQQEAQAQADFYRQAMADAPKTAPVAPAAPAAAPDVPMEDIPF